MLKLLIILLLLVQLIKTNDNQDDYDDKNDNEIANETTLHPSNYLPDINLNNEDHTIWLKPGNPIIDFIVIKHRYSNITNLAFPPYQHKQQPQQHGKIDDKGSFENGKILNKIKVGNDCFFKPQTIHDIRPTIIAYSN